MRTRCLLAVVPLLLSGCLTPITGRLDRTNQQVEVTNARLGEVAAQLAETSQRLADLERLLGETNQKLETIDKRMQVVEGAVRRVFPAPARPR